MISHESGGWILCAAVGLLTAALAWIGATRRRIDYRLWAQVGLSLGTMALGFATPHIDRVVLSLFFLATCVTQTMLGVQAPPAAVRRAA